MRRLDRGPLRRILKTILRSVSPHLQGTDPDDVHADPLRGWQRLAQATTRGSTAPLDDFLRDRAGTDDDGARHGELTWATRSSASVDELLRHVPSTHDDVGLLATLVLAHCYLDCIVIWEHTGDVGPLVDVLDVVADRAGRWADASPSGVAPEPEVGRLLRVIVAASRALVLEYAVEDAWASSCPTRVTATAGRATAALQSAREALGTGPAASGYRTDDPLLVGAPHGIERLLAESIDDALLYFQLLAEEVGPAAAAFADNLFDRRDDDRVAGSLRRARDATAVSTDRIRGVFRSEARAQSRTLDGMLDVVGAGQATGPARPTLVVDGGEIHFLFPFGLPSIGTGEGDLIQAMLQRHAEGAPDPQVQSRPTIAGCRVTIEEVLQTGVLASAVGTGLIDGPLSGRAGARLVFADDQLVLDTASGVRYRGLDVEVLLGAMGNHLVRMSVSTETRVERCSTDADHLDHPIGSCPGGLTAVSTPAWTPHELDLFLHRGGLDFGAERLFFAPAGRVAPHGPHDVRAATSHASEPPGDDVSPVQGPWSSIIELAAAIVLDVHDTVAELRSSAGGDASRGDHVVDGSRDLDVQASQLRRQAHVLAIVNEASSVFAGQRRPVRTPLELASCFGSGPLLSAQPPEPRAMEEWVCAAPLTPERLGATDGILGSLDGQVVCNGDSTLIFAPAAPNWQILEDREVVMFAISLGSAYALARLRLIEEIEATATLDVADDLASHPREELDRIAAEVRSTEQHLTAWVTYADALLDHALGAAVVRPRRDRQLLDHITERSGVSDLQQALLSSRSVAVDRLADLRDESGRILEAERRRGQNWVERFLLVVAVLAFIDLFGLFFDVEQDQLDWSWRLYFIGVVCFLVAAGAVIFSKVFRNGSR